MSSTTTTGGVRQERQQQTRERLLAAAARVFAQHGFNGASVPQIAAEAEVSTGAIYSNFSGKEELFLAMIGRLVEEGARGRAAAVADTGDDHHELLARVTGDWALTVEERQELVLLMAEFWLYAVRRPEMQPLLAAFLAGVRANFSTTIDEVVGDAEVDRDGLAMAIQALAYGYAMQHVADPSAVSGTQFTRAVEWLVDGAVR